MVLGRTAFAIHNKDLLKTDYFSTCVREIRFYPFEDGLTGQLEIEFNKRGTYVYHNFPVDEYAQFNQASSRGQYFNLYIRDAGYEYERVS